MKVRESSGMVCSKPSTKSRKRIGASATIQSTAGKNGSKKAIA